MGCYNTFVIIYDKEAFLLELLFFVERIAEASDKLEPNGFLYRVEICSICSPVISDFSISAHVRRYWPGMVKFSVKFEFGAKTENPILIGEMTEKAYILKSTIKRLQKQA